jgi:hypothetical protein
VLAISKDVLVLANGTRNGVATFMRLTPVLTEPELQIEVDPALQLALGEEFAATVVVNRQGQNPATCRSTQESSPQREPSTLFDS